MTMIHKRCVVAGVVAGVAVAADAVGSFTCGTALEGALSINVDAGDVKMNVVYEKEMVS